MTFGILYHSSKVIDLYAISKRLGNSNMTITAKTYAYMLDEYKAQQDDNIEKNRQQHIKMFANFKINY